MSVIPVLAAVGIIIFVIGQQIVGSGLTGRRVILLPAILTIIGLVQVTGHNAHATATDFGLIGLSAAIAHLMGAHAAAGTDAILLTLGLNRVAQAAVIVPRAVTAGIPFKPERDGKVFGAGLFPSPFGGRI